MTSFDQRSPDEQKHQYEEIAQNTLLRCNIHEPRVNWLAYTHNAVFDVQKDDTHYVLRLFKPNSSSPYRYSELIWLQAIREQTDLLAPNPVKYSVEGRTQDFVLFEYLEGISRTPETVTSDDIKKVGVFIARLHQFSQTYQPPEDFHRPRLDWEGLFGKSGIYHPGEAAAIFTNEQNAIFEATTERVREAMNSLTTQPEYFGLIHGDLLAKNILFHEGEVRALDFEFCGWGYFLYDLTPLLWQLKSQPHYQTLEDALWDSYSEMRSISGNQHQWLETVIAARQVASCRWLANNLHNPAVKDVARDLIEQRSNELKYFLRTGTLKRQSITL